jgi:hypothetical protein
MTNFRFSFDTEANEVAMVEIRDTDKLASLIETFVGKQGGASALFKENVFMGEKIRSMKFPIGEISGFKISFSYALFAGRLFYEAHLFEETPHMIPKIIAEIKKPSSPIAKELEMRHILKRVPKDAHAFNFANLKDGLETLLSKIDGKTREILIEQDTKKEAKAQVEANEKGTAYTRRNFIPPTMADRSKVGTLPWLGFASEKDAHNELSGEVILLRKETSTK